MASKSRRKGQVGERELADALSQAFPEHAARRNGQTAGDDSADVRWVDARAWTTMDEDVAAGGKALRFGKGDVGLIRIRDAN